MCAMTKSKKITMLILVALTLMVFSVSAVYGASALNVKAYPGVTILYNGKQLTDAQQPLIINDYTYVPLRMVMENFGKTVAWNAASQQVLITNSVAESQKEVDLINLQNENKKLQATIDQLNATIADLQNKRTGDADLDDIEDNLNDYFEDAGYDYFKDDDLVFSINLSGDEDEIEYDIEVDCGDSTKYDDLRDLSTSKIEDFLEDVEAEIQDEVDGTDYEDAKITGELVDSDYSRYYVKYNGRTYSFSWDSRYADEDLSDIASEVEDYFADAGENYFRDEGITVDITLSGDEDEIEYLINLDLRYADYDDSLEDLSTSRVQSLMSAVRSRIIKEAEGSIFEDADIVGKLKDSRDSSLYVTYDGSRYTFSY
jgi:cell division protein FtsB